MSEERGNLLYNLKWDARNRKLPDHFFVSQVGETARFITARQPGRELTPSPIRISQALAFEWMFVPRTQTFQGD
jgi:hypothetical protein